MEFDTKRMLHIAAYSTIKKIILPSLQMDGTTMHYNNKFFLKSHK